jgi:hypothetical protein
MARRTGSRECVGKLMKGMLKDMGNQLAHSFQELSPAQQ